MPRTAKGKRTLTTVSVKKFIDDYVYRIDLDADYQREKVWSREDRLKLLDSIIQDIDIPKLYLARMEDNEHFDYECIDGKQRMTTLLDFFKPDQAEDSPLTVKIAGQRYSYKRLKAELPQLAHKIENYDLTFVIYPEIDDEEFLREIFRRLQLGVRLNAGELLKSHTGTIRDFVYKEMGKGAPFLRNTNLSEKRFSIEFALAQICINSFSRAEAGNFVRARYEDLEDFIKDKYDIDRKDENLVRIRKVLTVMDEQFGESAAAISSRAVAVSAYLFAESLHVNDKSHLMPKFVEFFVELLDQVKSNLELLRRYKEPKNPTILERFQKYISQASVESHSIRRRQLFLEEAFGYFRDTKTKGKIIGGNR